MSTTGGQGRHLGLVADEFRSEEAIELVGEVEDVPSDGEVEDDETPCVVRLVKMGGGYYVGRGTKARA